MNKIAILFLCLAIISCNQETSKETDYENQLAEVNVDSLRSVFLAGWNNKDSTAIMNTIAENAVVMNDSLIHSGTHAISKNWVSGGVKVLSNIKTNSSISDGNGNIAYDGGTYSLDLTPPGGPVLKERGNYSLVWARQKNGEWRLILVHIEDVTRLPDIK
jgi:ketosteroid isomerase-like protein